MAARSAAGSAKPDRRAAWPKAARASAAFAAVAVAASGEFANALGPAARLLAGLGQFGAGAQQPGFRRIGAPHRRRGVQAQRGGLRAGGRQPGEAVVPRRCRCRGRARRLVERRGGRLGLRLGRCQGCRGLG